MDSLLLTVTRVHTFSQDAMVTSATGFFFAREKCLFFVTSRHVLFDEPSGHYPDRIEIELHIDPANLGASIWFSVPLYVDRQAVWRQGSDAGGAIDVAAVELQDSALPDTMAYRAFTPAHLLGLDEDVEIGSPLLVVGYPLGFHDSLHHLPVVRHAVVASSFGLRFQGKGQFLTDARTHRGTSGAPVVMTDNGRLNTHDDGLHWTLLGVHSTRFDIGARDTEHDEALGLNCAWYADILMKLTER
jgi:hypothetical protein